VSINPKEVKRAIRDFDRAIQAIQVASVSIYQTRINEFIKLIKENNVLNLIINPYLKIDINFKEIETSHDGHWVDLKLPTDKELQIAYVLQVLEKSSNGEFALENYSFFIFRNSSFNVNIDRWNTQILEPIFNVLTDRLGDLIEDEVEGKQGVNPASLHIINYGSISANNGNVGIGQDIKQSVSIGEISHRIIEKAIKENVISEIQVDEVKNVTDEIETELQKEEPSKSNLTTLAQKLHEIGQRGLLSLATNTINDPRWGEAVAGFLLSV
jgi:hypothetical protein